MKYFKVNYDQLLNLKQINYFKYILFIIFLVSSLILFSHLVKISTKIECPAYYQNSKLILKINTNLSDNFRKNKYIYFNNTKVKYQIIEYQNYEIIENNIYQEMILTVDKEFVENEVGIVKLHYNSMPLIKYIFELFK